MKRQALDAGGWFDIESAKMYKEKTNWNGNNHISKATGSQWEHEQLYKTKKGKWILNHWSQFSGSTESWTEISAAQAAQWLIVNEHSIDDGSLNKEMEKTEL